MTDGSMTGSAVNADPETLAKIAQARTLSTPDFVPPPFQNIGALFAARAAQTPTANFLTFYDDTGKAAVYSYTEFFTNARRAATLLTNLGLTIGDRIATLTINDPRAVMIYFAAWFLGVTVVPINCGEDDERIQYILSDAEVKAIFAAGDQTERCLSWNDSLPHLRHVVSFTDEGGFEARLERLTPIAPRDVPAATEALIVYTSGTTGPPKGVVLDQANLLNDAQAIAGWHRFGPDDRALCILPIHHVNGTTVTLVTPLVSGGSVVLCRRFRAHSFWQTLASEKCTWTSVVPTILAFLCEGRADLSRYDLSKFRHIVCGAGPLTVELAARFDERFHIRVVHGYGLSETTCYSSFLPIDLSQAQYDYWMKQCGFPSIGCPLPVNDMAIHDEQGNALGPNARGEIVARGLNVMKYYYKRPDANASTFAHGWFRSGDEGYFQAGPDGRDYYFITGRLKELIIRGGVNYSPFDIDEVLSQIPGVKAAMAVGFDNIFYGEEVGAYVQREENAAVSADEILEFCRARLPFAKAPKVVIFGDTFPVTSTGKYQRLKLKPLFAEWKDSEFRQARG